MSRRTVPAQVWIHVDGLQNRLGHGEVTVLAERIGRAGVAMELASESVSALLRDLADRIDQSADPRGKEGRRREDDNG